MLTISQVFNLKLNHDRLCALGATITETPDSIRLTTKNMVCSYLKGSHEYTKIKTLIDSEIEVLPVGKSQVKLSLIK